VVDIEVDFIVDEDFWGVVDVFVVDW